MNIEYTEIQKANNFLWYAEIIINTRIENLIIYIKNLDNTIEDFKKSKPKFIDGNLDSYYHDIFPQISYNATIVMIFLYFESLLKELIESVDVIKKVKPKLEDNSGNNYIRNCRLHLVKVLNINFDDISTTWSKINELQKLRNIVIHNDGSILKNKNKKLERQELFNFFKKYPEIELFEDGSFCINDSKILYDFCEIVEVCLLKIFEKVEGKI